MSMTYLDGIKLKELAYCYVDVGIEINDIWQAYRKGFLYELFKSDKNPNCQYLIWFSDIVSEVLNKKLNAEKIKPVKKLSDGKWLHFYPSDSMYDGLAETESSGFYDSCDVPPPEFWVGFYDDILVSFIPEIFVYTANLGVDISMSGSLVWDKYGQKTSELVLSRL